MRPHSERELKSLVALLDDDDPGSVDLVSRRILDIGDPILPYLDDFRASCASEVTARIDSLVGELRLRKLRESFLRLAAVPEVDLEEGAWLLARFGYPGVNPAVYTGWLDQVAQSVRRSLPEGADSYAAMQRLNTHLFSELSFSGNEERYYDPDNSYLNRVIDNRRGIPVSLSVLYLVIAKRLGLPVHGVGTPGHFLVGFREPNSNCFYIDTFHHGRLLSAQDVRRMLLRSGYEFRIEFLDRCSSRDILARMMRNLISIYQKTGSPVRAETLSGLVEILLTGKDRSARR